MSKLKTAVYICVFVLVWVPLILPIIPGYTQNFKTNDFSLYNPLWTGCSILKMELSKDGYDVRPILSSLSVLSRAKNATLILLSPSSFINPIELSELADFVREGGGLLIAAEDSVYGNYFTFILFSILGLQPPMFDGHPLYGSYRGGLTEWTSVPTISSFNTSHPIFEGVRQIVLNIPTALYNVPPENQVAVLAPGLLDLDRNGRLELNRDLLLPSATIAAVYDLEKMGIEIGGQRISYGKGRIVVLSDPSIFVNDMILRGDNLRFALNIVNWLSRKDDGGGNLVIFDEARLATPYYSYDKIFGSILGYIDWASANWLLAPIYPVLIAFSIWRWLPRKKPKEMGPTAVYLKRGKTFLTEKLRWYKENRQYGYALKLLYRRMRRHLIKRFSLKVYDVDVVVKLVAELLSDMRKEQLKRFFEEWESIDKGEKPVYMGSEAFLNHFFVMKKIMEAVMVGKRG